MHIFVVNLNEVALDEVLLVFPAVDHGDDLVEASRNDASEVVDVLLSLLGWALSLHAVELDIDALLLHILLSAHYGVSLAASRLSIGEDGAIVSLEHVFDDGEGGVLVDVLLSGLRGEYFAEGK